MDLNNIEYRKSYPSSNSNKGKNTKKTKAVKKKKTKEDWARIEAWKKKQEKQRINNLTTKVIEVDGKKVRILKSTQEQSWGNVKRRARPRREAARITRIKESK